MNNKIIDGFEHSVYCPIQLTQTQSAVNADAFYQLMKRRRSIRHFSKEMVPKEIIEDLIKTAGTSPSGANKQPWTFCAIANKALKSKIRVAAEREEYLNYQVRMSDRWKQDLQPFATNWEKPFLEIAPWLIVIFRKVYENESGMKSQNYYTNESVGIASGLLIAAIHHAGLVTLTHTPSPMNFLSKILSRPDNERPFLLLPVGYPEKDSLVPMIGRKSIEEIASFYE